MLRARLKTTGIQALEFFHPDDSWCKLLGITPEEKEDMGEEISPNWKLIDVGGQRSERRKWLPYMEIVQGVMFLVNAHGYKLCLYEDASTLRIHEDMGLFQGTLRTSFKTIPLTLVFTKEDLYHSHFDPERFRQAFPDCIDEKLDSKRGMKYMQRVFETLAPADRKCPIRFLEMTTFNLTSVRHTFVDMQNKILEQNQIKILKLCGLIEEVTVDANGKKTGASAPKPAAPSEAEKTTNALATSF